MMKYIIAAIFLFASLAQIDAFPRRARDDVVPKPADDLNLYMAASMYAVIKAEDVDHILKELGVTPDDNEYVAIWEKLDPKDLGFISIDVGEFIKGLKVVPKLTGDLKLYKALSPYAEIEIDDLEDILENVGLDPGSFVEMSHELDIEGERDYFTIDAFVEKMNKINEKR